MKINGKDYNINELQELQKDNFYKRTKHGIMLNKEQRDILRKYHFDYEKYTSLESLLFDIESYLNEEENFEDLDAVSKTLSEIYYYNHVNK